MGTRTPPAGQAAHRDSAFAISHEPHGPEASAIRLQLARLLASPHICHSKRCQALLQYVVEAYLEGSPERVKERIIGFEVFQRKADYDTNQDSVVRTTAAEVRKRLAQYYLEPGHENEIRVVLPQGAYLPEFRMPAAPLSPLSVVETPALPPAVLPASRVSRSARIVGLALAVAAMLGTGLWFWPGFHQTDVDRFWAPVIGDHAEAVICIEQPLKIFSFTGPRTDELNSRMFGSGNSPPTSAEAGDAKEVKLSELSPAGDRYFTFGDLMAASRLSELLARKGKPFQLLGDRVTSYHDLRGRPAILLGQFNNKWTAGMTGGLRFYLDKNAATQTYEVRDRQHPPKVLASVSKINRTEEYAIISRIFEPSTEKTVIAVSGMTFFGTLAGADFLTHQAYIEEALRGAPSGWKHKNIQVVLKSAMVGGLPGPPKVVATYFW